ncbi:hypothetical protein MRX96_029201 [Rhipicephalus microplus]
MSDDANPTSPSGVGATDDVEKGTAVPDSVSGAGPSTTAAEDAGSTEDALLLSTSKEEASLDDATEVAFSAQQQSDRWIVVFLVAGLYVFFYAIGGLAYYLLDVYGYTVDYSGRANHTTTESFVVGGRQW